jgi:phospholipase C
LHKTSPPPNDPNHSISGVNMQLFSTYRSDANSPKTMQGSDSEQAYTYTISSNNISRATEAINYYSRGKKAFDELVMNGFRIVTEEATSTSIRN